MANYYNRDGEPISPQLWWREFDDSESRRVDYTQIGDVEVLTVFLGLDHQLGEGPPLIYETMAFGGKLADECERYTTEAQAKFGHAAMVRRVKEGGQ